MELLINGGGTATTAEKYNLPLNFVMLFLAQIIGNISLCDPFFLLLQNNSLKYALHVKGDYARARA